MQNDISEKQNFSIYESIVVGIFFYFLIGWTKSPETVPLFDFHPHFFLNIFLPILSSVVMILVFFQRKYLRVMLSLAIISLLIVTTYRYSGNYAFRYFALLVLGFSIIFHERDNKEKITGSVLIIGFLFLFSALQKINPEYLRGSEFVSGSSFMSFYDLWFPGLLPGQLHGHYHVLPYFSILIELVIAIGIFFRPRLFIHIAALFVLFLSFLNPPVLTVYFFLLPFFILINEDLYKKMDEFSFSNLLRTPFFWAFFIYISISNIQVLGAAVTRNFIFVIVLLIFHLKNFKWRAYPKEDYFFTGRTLFLPVVMVVLFLGSYLFLPSPFGFKMFSGRRFQVAHYDLKIDSTEACHYGQAKWFFSPVTDSDWIISGNECHLLFPTEDGVHYVKRQLCQKFGSLVFHLKKSDDLNEQVFSCSEIGK